MKFFEKKKANNFLLLFAMSIFVCNVHDVHAQETMIGEQNGTTWKNLVIGTPEESISRKTFYVDGLYDMSVFWSQHAELKIDAVNFNDAFIGINVGQIRDGLDSFYVDDRNLQVPIVDAVLIIRLQNAQISKAKVDDIIRQFREATINGTDPTREDKIWREALRLLI
ncbi:MAG: hypothetical protein ACLP05_07495 [Candidatus Kryptoniota bacterium]